MTEFFAKQAMLAGVIDYAGTFPPAELSLEEALKKASSFRKSAQHPWLLGRVTLKLSDIKKLSSSFLYSSGADGSAWILTALGTPIDDKPLEEVIRQIEWDLREIRHCHEKGFYGSCRMAVVAYETKLPFDALAQGACVKILDRLSNFRGVLVDPYFEVGPGDFKSALSKLKTDLYDWLSDNEELRIFPGIKVRTGGKSPVSLEQLADTLLACHEGRFKFKATQGLHEAITHGDSFGFVNLFAAINLLFSNGSEKFGQKIIMECLKDNDPKSFKFSGKTFSWKKWSLDSESIEAARRIHSGCFGSCSLDEPEESLLKEFK